MVFVYNGWISGLHPRQFFVTDEDTVMHDDQVDATRYVDAAIKKLIDEMAEEMLSNAFRIFGVYDSSATIDSTAFVLDETQRMLPAPVHNSTTERCRIMDNDEPL